MRIARMGSTLLIAFVACAPRAQAPCPCACPPEGAASVASASPSPTGPASAPGVAVTSAPESSVPVAKKPPPSPAEVAEAYEDARAKFNAGDGKGCLAELDALDASGPKHPSTDPKSSIAMLRGQCLLMAGQCQKGRAFLQQVYAIQLTTVGPEQAERTAEYMTITYCKNVADLTQRERLLLGLQTLQNGAYMTKKTVKECTEAHETVKALSMVVPPKDDDDTQVLHGPKNAYLTAANCLARAGDCAAARKVHHDGFPAQSLASIKDPATKAKVLESAFDSGVPKCSGKP